jgi:uncharacterized protein (TIGR00730 family)
MDTSRKNSDESRRVSLGNEEGVTAIVRETITALWETVNNLTRLEPSRRERYRVTIFGSARSEPDSLVYNEVRRVARMLAELGCDIITGGGPGLMQAANEGAAEGDSCECVQSMGIRIHLPFEQDPNPFVEEAFTHRTFFTRLHHFVLASDAFVVAPGGIGTLLEASMIWQLLQVRHLDGTPLIFVGNMWKGLVEWAEANMEGFDPPLVSPEDLQIPTCAATADEAIEILKKHHAEWKISTPGDQGARGVSHDV